MGLKYSSLFTPRRASTIIHLMKQGHQIDYIESITRLPQGTIQGWLNFAEEERARFALMDVADYEEIVMSSCLQKFAADMTEAKDTIKTTARNLIHEKVAGGSTKLALRLLEMYREDEVAELQAESHRMKMQLSKMKLLKELKSVAPEIFKEYMADLGLGRNEVAAVLEDFNARRKTDN